MTFTVRYLTALKYSPRGNSQIDIQSQQVKNNIKGWSTPLMRRLKERFSDDQALLNFFPIGAYIIPIPSSSLVKSDSLRVPFEICSLLADIRPDLTVYDCLLRYKAIPKASSSFTGEERPKVEDNLNSIKFTGQTVLAKDIILVDDVLTKGITSVACARIIKDSFPEVNISVFAVLTTTDSLNEIYSLERGTITLYDSLKVFKQRLSEI